MPDDAPLVFLDVDGVLHPLIVELRDGKLRDEHCFGAECMRQLKRIVDITGAEIVLGSSWRQFEEPRRRLAAALASQGMSFKRWTTTNLLDGTCASQILKFVNEHGRDSQAWVVLDDEDVTAGRDGMLMQVVRDRFVQTDGQTGLTKEDADKAIAVLSGCGEDED